MDILQWILAGTAPQWGVFVVVSLAFIKIIIPWREQNFTSMKDICDTLKTQVEHLTSRLDECEARCTTRDATILGMKKQSIAQQIGFARVLMSALGSDNPELKNMLKTLENLEQNLEKPELLGDLNA